MTHEDVQSWLDGYIAAWRSGEASAIGELFAEGVRSSYRPWTDDHRTITGRDDVVASWMADPDDPRAWDAHYEPYAVEGDRAVAVGWSHYEPAGEHPERTYHNAFLLHFDEAGRCSEFREFWMLRP